jgi:hypothetical protein
MPYTPEESELVKYLDPQGIGTDEPLTGTRFRELKLTGWTDRDEKGVTPPLWNIGYKWSFFWFGKHFSPTAFIPNIISLWHIMALLTFALRRPLDKDQWEIINSWWKHYSSSLGIGDEVSDRWYSYYVGPKFYSHAIYFDPSAELDSAPTILRLGGNMKANELGAMGGGTIEVVKPREIPLFPQWDDKIINRFHRSDDPEMRSYTKALDDWSALMHNAISRLA